MRRIRRRPGPSQMEVARRIDDPHETIRTDASVEQIADALLSPVEVRWIDRPRGKRAKR